MVKVCPECHHEQEGNVNFCPQCGSRMVEKEIPATSSIGLGDANAISGGIHINQSKSSVSQDTHYHTTINEPQKSETERKLDSANRLREQANQIMAEKGRIEPASLNQLRNLAVGLGIDEENFRAIIKEVRNQRTGLKSGLSSTNARYLQQAMQAIQADDRRALSELMPRLEAMASISVDDNVQYVFNMGLALFDPHKLIQAYENSMDESYWRTFWTIVTYIRFGEYKKAARLLARFDPLRYEKPEDDLKLLEAFFNLTQGNKETAQEFLDEVFESSPYLQPFHVAVEKLAFEEETNDKDILFYDRNILSMPDDSSREILLAALEGREVNIPKPEPVQNEKPAAVTQSESIGSEPQCDSEEAQQLYFEATQETDDAKRVQLLQKAAEAGSSDAMTDLAECYSEGVGVEEDEDRSFELVKKAADLGNARALFMLGLVSYASEEEYPQYYDKEKGLECLQKAASKNFPDAIGYLAMIYLQEEDFDKAFFWAQKGAMIDNAEALYALGLMYSNGFKVEENLTKGFEYLKKAADLGEKNAQDLVGDAYFNGSGVGLDYTEAFRYYKMAALQDNGTSMVSLARCLVEGYGTFPDFREAKEWLKKAAELEVEGAEEYLEAVEELDRETSKEFWGDFFSDSSDQKEEEEKQSEPEEESEK